MDGVVPLVASMLWSVASHLHRNRTPWPVQMNLYFYFTVHNCTGTGTGTVRYMYTCKRVPSLRSLLVERAGKCTYGELTVCTVRLYSTSLQAKRDD